MEKPQKIKINDVEYYLANELYEFDKPYFIGCAKTVRRIVEKKDIPKKFYEYVVKKNNKYEIGNEEYNKAKLALKCEWVEENIPSMSNGKIKNEFENEPNQIVLSKQEMTDINGNKMDIVIVGQREYDKCYFRAKDVEEYFNSPNLRKTIISGAENGYIKGKHYVYFIRKNIIDTSPNKKILYLTTSGICRTVYTHHMLSDEYKLFLIDWILNIINFDKNKLCYIEKNKKIQKNMIYCITSPLVMCCKLGKWHGNLNGLLKRYLTYFGSETQYIVGNCIDCNIEETIFLSKMKSHKICNELFDKKFINKYIEYIITICGRENCNINMYL